MSEISEINLNEEVEMVVEDASVITTPIDPTLSVSGDAADAKAVGEALALKADRSELQNAVTVNGQSADAQGAILLEGNEIPMSETDSTTLKDAIEALQGMTGADIPIDAEAGATSVADHVGTLEESVTELQGDLANATADISSLQETYVKQKKFRTSADKTFSFTLPIGSTFLILSGRQNSTQTGLIGMWIGVVGTAGAALEVIQPSATEHPSVSVSGNQISITTNTTMTCFFTVLYVTEYEDK